MLVCEVLESNTECQILYCFWYPVSTNKRDADIDVLMTEAFLADARDERLMTAVTAQANRGCDNTLRQHLQSWSSAVVYSSQQRTRRYRKEAAQPLDSNIRLPGWITLAIYTTLNLIKPRSPLPTLP